MLADRARELYDLAVRRLAEADLPEDERWQLGTLKICAAVATGLLSAGRSGDAAGWLAIAERSYHAIAIDALRPHFERGFKLLTASQAGGRTKAAQRRCEIAATHAARRRQAVDLWSRHPTWSAAAVARHIDKNAESSIRHLIGDLKPRPQK